MPEKLRKIAEHLINEGYVDNEPDALLMAMRMRMALDEARPINTATVWTRQDSVDTPRRRA